MKGGENEGFEEKTCGDFIVSGRDLVLTCQRNSPLYPRIDHSSEQSQIFPIKGFSLFIVFFLS